MEQEKFFKTFPYELTRRVMLRSDTDEQLLFEAASIQAAGRHNAVAFVQVGGRRYAIKDESLIALAQWWGFKIELEKEAQNG